MLTTALFVEAGDWKETFINKGLVIAYFFAKYIPHEGILCPHYDKVDLWVQIGNNL